MTSYQDVVRSIENNELRYFTTVFRDHNFNPNSFGQNGNTIFSSAVRKANLQTISHLIKTGADVNLREKGGATPLLLAIRLGRFDVVQCLINHGANITFGDSYDTPLTVAIRENHLDMVEFLIDRGANYKDTDIKGVSPLFITIKENKPEFLDLFLNKGIGFDLVDSSGDTLLISAIRNHSSIDIIQILINYEIDVNESKNQKTPLSWAAHEGRLEVIKFLVGKGANVNGLGSDGDTALSSAVCCQQTEIVSYLIDHGANVCKVGENGETPLFWAVQQQDLEMINLLLDKGAEFIVDSVFCDAVETRNLEIVKLLVRRGGQTTQISVEHKNWESFQSALVESVKAGSLEIVKYLFDNGVRLEDLPFTDVTIVVFLLQSGTFDMVKLLIENGARLNATGAAGHTPLTKSVEIENLEMVQYFLTKGAEVNQPRQDGLTPLKIAEAKKDFQIFQYLVDCGATISVEDEENNGSLARHYRKAKEISLRRGKLPEDICSNQEEGSS